MLGVLEYPQNRVTNILGGPRKSDIGNEPIVRNDNNKTTAGIESSYASINQAKGLGGETAISSVESSAIDKEKDRSFASFGSNRIINVKLVSMFYVSIEPARLGNGPMEIGYLMPIGLSVPESLRGNLADERFFGFDQWSESSDRCG